MSTEERDEGELFPTDQPRARLIVIESNAAQAQRDGELLRDLGYFVIDTVCDLQEGVEQASRRRPTLVLLGVHPPAGAHHVEAVGTLRALGVPTVLALARYDETAIAAVKRSGALACLLRPYDRHELHTTLEMAMAQAQEPPAPAMDRRVALENSIRGMLDAMSEAGVRQLSYDRSGSVYIQMGDETLPCAGQLRDRVLRQLSRRERQVLEVAVRGLDVAEIAADLGISRNTVRNHMQAVFRKAGVHSQLELIRVWWGLRVDGEDHGGAEGA